jgi:hypothetical protein
VHYRQYGGRSGGFGQSRGSALEGRRLWEIGGWGNASDHIGQRWEDLGRRALADLLGNGGSDGVLGRSPSNQTLLCLVDDESVQSALRSIGLTNPDALLAELAGNSIRLRPVDFKWSIETASYRQISAEALRALVDHADSPLPGFARGVLGAADAPIETLDGFFLSPDNRVNRQFVDSAENRRQEYPIDPEEVVFATVDGREFFGVLPWWAQAEFLASLDRMPGSLDTIDGAERYYRLGAGLGGALVKLATCIFAAEPADIDVPAATSALLARNPFRTSQEIITHLRHLMMDRDERVRRLKELGRCPYSFGEMLGDLLAAGAIVTENGDPATKENRVRWGPVHRGIVDEHRAAVSAAGLDLVRSGHTEHVALNLLFERRGEFAAAARERGRSTLARELASGSWHRA